MPVSLPGVRFVCYLFFSIFAMSLPQSFYSPFFSVLGLFALLLWSVSKYMHTTAAHYLDKRTLANVVYCLLELCGMQGTKYHERINGRIGDIVVERWKHKISLQYTQCHRESQKLENPKNSKNVEVLLVSN